VVTAGVSLFTAAVFWYAQWWVEAHTVYRLCASVGGRSVCFAIEKPASALGSLLGLLLGPPSSLPLALLGLLLLHLLNILRLRELPPSPGRR